MTPTHRRPGRPCNERGANLVELALLLPFLFMLLMGVADLGRAFYTYVSLTNAAREGARFASRFPFEDNEDDIAEIIRRVQDEPNIAGVAWDAVVVEIEGLGSASGDPVTVTATLDLDTFIGTIFGLPSITVSTQATMIIYGVDGATL